MTLAKTAVPGQVDFEAAQIEEYLASDHAYLAGVADDEVSLEAFRRLVMTPFETETVAEACERVAVIISVLRQTPSDRSANYFELMLSEMNGDA